MPRVQWPLRRGRPCVEVFLTLAASGQPFQRMLVADTGAGSTNSGIHLLLEEDDCLLCVGHTLRPVTLRGAYAGSFPSYALSVRVPALGFNQYLRAVGVPSVPTGFDGIACFSFLNRFTYGNFGDPSQFGLEC
jgi:hypothetical protein